MTDETTTAPPEPGDAVETTDTAPQAEADTAPADAGVINPPAANKYGYWTRSGKLAASPDKWLEKATRHEGSWWPDWAEWLASRSGKKVPRRIPGEGALAVIEQAPGSFVRVRADET